ncbi:hypothetical protein Clacol_008954 [Clathrus columnatus]|uniref:Origin recognition complex subunit 3 n=1 Tax=Clathrus columnatus TaxID=1419009 RepID=A0AAV5AJ53_9AGAM|nr:hypothetical protein Clacol_008954 [Clathrus columnatus]
MTDLLDQGVIIIPYEEDEATNPAEENIDGPLVRSEIDLPGGPLFRFQAYRQAWEECLERTKKILLKLQKPVVEEVVCCIYDPILQQEDEFLLPNLEMMTILVSCPDRAFARSSIYYICKTLTYTLGPEDSDSDDHLPHALLSQIHETDCANLTLLVKALITGFINFPLHKKPNFKYSSIPSDMHILVRYIEEVKIQYGPQVLLLVVLPDVSLIDPMLLGDFLDLCYCHIPTLPFTILTTTSDMDYLNRVLSRSTLTRLRLEKFRLPCDRQTFEHIVEETFFSLEFSPKLIIGPSGLDMIISDFSRNNATLDGLLSNIQGMSESDWSDFSPSKVLEKTIEGRKLFHNRMRHAKVALRIWNIIRKFCRNRNFKFPNTSLLEISVEVLRMGITDSLVNVAISSIRSLDETQAQALLEELYFFVCGLPSAVRNLTTGLKGQIAGTRNTFTLDKLESFCDFMKRYFRSTLMPLNDIPLLDMWWTDDENLPNSPFNPNVHVSIVTALLEPRGYLDWGMGMSNNNSADACPLPDVSIAFQRYVDSGKMINLYDWHQSFSMAFETPVDQEEDDIMDVDDTPTKPRHKISSSRLAKSNNNPAASKTSIERVDKRELQARFMRTVHELEFVGFLKRTGRRTEHVTKTIFDVMD